MKKIGAFFLGLAIAIGSCFSIWAAPIYDNDHSMLNTVVGFSEGKKIFEDLDHREEEKRIPFSLGANAPYYEVDVQIQEGAEYILAYYDASPQELVIKPLLTPLQTGTYPYRVSVRVQEKRTQRTVTSGYVISGQIRYDAIQVVETEGGYHHAHGTLYQINAPVSMQIYTGQDATLYFDNAPRGFYNLDLSRDGDFLPDHLKHPNVQVFRFLANPQLESEALLMLHIPQESTLYLYDEQQERLYPITPLETPYDTGYFLKTRQLGTYVAYPKDFSPSDTVLSQDQNEKNNPSTGACPILIDLKN